ncbi:MAG TPA: Calx-beta domain-containing protein [Pyrinomonadaceae bacterium]
MSYRKTSGMRATLRLTLALTAVASLAWLTLPSSVWNGLEPRASAASFVVTTVDDNGDDANPTPGSLRKAIIDANASAGADTITFQIGSGLQTIQPLSALPTITDPVTIDGTTQPGFSGAPIIEIDGSKTVDSKGLYILAGNSTVRGLVINRFRYAAIYFWKKGNNKVEGNYLGTNASGTAAFPKPNNGIGVVLECDNNVVGGDTVAQRNVIAGNINDNGSAGILIYSHNNKIVGNYIGTDVTGMLPIRHNSSGITMSGSNNIIGGPTSAERNIISNNSTNVNLAEAAHDNKVQGNWIGLKADGTSTEQGIYGVALSQNAHDNIIGGTNSGEGNVIAYNSGVGVRVASTTTVRNSILGNSIYLNQFGIDLGLNVVTPNDYGATQNDPSDADIGPNNLQNYPEITSVAANGGDTIIDGILRSEANKSYRIELFSNTSCDVTGYGQGKSFVAATSVTTDSSGNANFNFTVPTANIAGAIFTATATDPNHNTSEFSQCKSSAVAAAGTIQFGADFLSVNESAGTVDVNVTRTGGSTGAVSVSYATSNGTATAGSDYMSKTGQINFADGETAKQISINISDDLTSEPNKNFLVTLSTPTGGATLGPQTQVNITIADNDAPSITISDVQVQEGNSGTTNATFTLSINVPHYKQFSVEYATVDGGTATSGDDYQPTSGTLTFATGEISKPVTVLVNGDPTQEPSETFLVKLSNNSDLSISKGTGTGTIINDDVQSDTIELSSPTYTIKEGTINTPQGFTSLTVNVTRSGNTSTAASVQYFTSDQSGGNECDQVTEFASQRCDYTTVAGTLRFAAGETSKQIRIPIINDGYADGSEVFKISLQNAVGAALGAIKEAKITITDSGIPATISANNPYLNNEFFVRQNYLDFLGREPDDTGWNPPTGWPVVLGNCGPEEGFLGAPKNCDRAHVSHGFFASPEFTDKGFAIYRLYEVGMGRLPLYAEFIPDMATLSGYGIPANVEQQNLQDYLESFTQRTEFINRFQGALQTNQAEQLILKLEQTTGITLPATAVTNPGQPTQYGRNELIQKRSIGAFTVGQTLKAFIEQQAVYDKFFPRGFVTMQYFAYLRRDPNLNDPNMLGWNDWVDVFTNGKPSAGIQPKDYHHLIFGFIYSTEYRKRFGQP